MKRMRQLVVVVALCFIYGVYGSSQLVQTEYGFVQGVTTNTSKVWLNVPYAAPPVGSLRWQPPQAHSSWPGVLNTSQYGAVCPQPNALPNQSEDCLYLNVYVPLNADNATLLPVLVWIHGGSFINGVGYMYDGAWLNAGNVIVVTINYRLGALGFLANPALMKASSEPTTGFYGVQDQRFALQWVQNNIKAFGGNPAQVTVGGESAGAISVCVHLVAPRSFGLYSQALSESGYCEIWPQDYAFNASNTIIENVGCGNVSSADLLSCLQSKTPQEIVAANTLSIIHPMLHAYEIEEQPITLILNDTYNPVPLLAGTNRNEMSLFLCPQYPNGLNESDYASELIALYGQTQGIALFSQYPPSNYESPLQALIAVESDQVFKCPTKLLANVNAKHAATFMYSFEHVPSFSEGPCYGVAHSYELPFVFPYGPVVGQDLTYREWITARNMADAWSTFVNNGAPAMPCAGVIWQPIALNNSYMVLELPPKMAADFDDSCQYWL